jgi:hypothetical protein
VRRASSLRSRTAGASICRFCTVCAVNTYSLAGSDGCLSSVAPSGHYFSTVTATCVTCPANSYCPGGSVQQQACTTTCSSGQYVASACNATSNLVCAQCPAGSYCPSPSASTCTACVAGTNYCPAGSTAPIACGTCTAGKYIATACTVTSQAVCQGMYTLPCRHTIS